MKKRLRMNFQRKILFSMIIMLLFAMLIYGGATNRVITDALQENLRQYSENYMDDFKVRIEDKTKILYQDVFREIQKQHLNVEEQFQYLMEHYEQNNVVSRKMHKMAYDFFNINPYIYGVAFCDQKGQYYSLTESPNKDYTEELKKLLETKEIKGNHVMALNDAYFVLLKELIDIVSMKKIGECIVLVSSDYYFNTVQYSLKANGWHVVLLDSSHNKIFASSEKAQVQYNHWLNENLSNSGTYWYQGAQFFYNLTDSEHDNIEILNIIPGKAITEGTRKLQLVMLLLGVIILLCVFLISIYVSRKLSVSVMQIVDGVNDMAEGNLKRRLKISTEDEFAVISREINRMADSIEELIEKVYVVKISEERARRKTVEAEYAALRAKMNPHFIYNVLEGINSLAKISHQPDISEVSCLLAELLRETLDDDREFIYLEDELEYISKYIKLKTIMRKNHFEYIIDLDEILLGAAVPRFLLQPIIENAFKHGIDKISNAGIIRLSCHLHGEDIVITITDNGYGNENHPIEDMIPEKKDWKNSKIGLKSIHKRLQFLYGEQYGVDIAFHKNETVLTVRLPYRSEL